MAWQDIYGELQDDCGGRAHTSSRKGIVKNIAFRVVTTEPGGTVLDIDVIKPDRFKTYDIGEIKRKIQEWKNKESHTKSKEGMISYWENKLKIAETHNSEVKQKNKVRILLNFPSINLGGLAEKEVLVHLEGTELDLMDLTNLRQNQSKFKEFLETLKRREIQCEKKQE